MAAFVQTGTMKFLVPRTFPERGHSCPQQYPKIETLQENRSFDEYFGSLKGVHGFSDRNALIFQNGTNAGSRTVGPGRRR